MIWLKRIIQNWLLKTVLRAISVQDVMRIDERSRKIFLGGEIIDEKQLRMLREEAGYIKRTFLWKVLTNTLAEQARLTMFTHSKSWEDMLIGKMMLYNIDVQEKVLETILTTKLEAKKAT